MPPAFALARSLVETGFASIQQTSSPCLIAWTRAAVPEERVHAGEFLRLLRELAPDEKAFYAKGTKEVEDEIKKMK
jgi:hypothetical protein